jgi:hypothetical protein
MITAISETFKYFGTIKNPEPKSVMTAARTLQILELYI